MGLSNDLRERVVEAVVLGGLSWVRSCRGAPLSVGSAVPHRLQPEEAMPIPIRAGRVSSKQRETCALINEYLALSAFDRASARVGGVRRRMGGGPGLPATRDRLRLG